MNDIESGRWVTQVLHTGSKYVRVITTLSQRTDKVDIYCVLDAYDVRCPAIQHAVKKLLMPGTRGKGDTMSDLIEAKDAIQRAIELLQGRIEMAGEK